MTETIRFRKIYAEDLRTGSGTEEVTLADGSIVSLTKINLSEIDYPTETLQGVSVTNYMRYKDSNGTILHGFGNV